MLPPMRHFDVDQGLVEAWFVLHLEIALRARPRRPMLKTIRVLLFLYLIGIKGGFTEADPDKSLRLLIVVHIARYAVIVKAIEVTIYN